MEIEGEISGRNWEKNIWWIIGVTVWGVVGGERQGVALNNADIKLKLVGLFFNYDRAFKEVIKLRMGV